MDFLEGSLQVFELASCLFLQAQSSSPTSAPAVFSVFRALFSCNPVVFLETSGFFQITTPRVLFLPSQQPPRKSPKLPARRADVTAAGCARPRGFVLLCRLRLLPLPKFARRRPFSALGVPATLPHVGATSGFLVSGGYVLGCVQKAAQTADTGATGCDWRFVCALNLCFQQNRHISSLPHPRPASAFGDHSPAGAPLESVGL